MKNKKNIYILLPIVLFIWGSVLYEFFSFSNQEEFKPKKTVQNNLIKPFLIKKKDSFFIDVNYRDPFLGKIYSKPEKVKSIVRKNKIIKKIKIDPAIIWPIITYRGIVSDTKNKAKVFMIIINNKTSLLQIGQTDNEVKLKEGNREYVYVIYKKQLKIVLIQE